MKWFGTPWKAAVCEDSPRVEVPVGRPCYLCEKPIEATHRGVVLPFHGKPEDPPELNAHLYCFARSLGLKVGH